MLRYRVLALCAKLADCWLILCLITGLLRNASLYWLRPVNSTIFIVDVVCYIRQRSAGFSP